MGMIKKQIAFCLCVLAFVAMTNSAGFCADSASFDPVPVSIKATGGGLPVGTVVAWPISSNPPDYESWLECNGQTISRMAYPELYALVGGAVPDYRGMFLRGHGGKSGALGQEQKDAVSVDEAIDLTLHGAGYANVGGPGNTNNTSLVTGPVALRVGTWSQRNSANTPGRLTTSLGSSGSVKLKASFTGTGTDNETRPVNKAVRYIIRAKP